MNSIHLLVKRTLLVIVVAIVSCPTTFPIATGAVQIQSVSTADTNLLTVTKVQSRSDWFLVETSRGYALLEWFGGTSPSENQQFYGNVHKFGFVELSSKIGSRRMKVWVDDYALSKQSALEKLAEKVKNSR
jgi:hypothetical protein